MLSPLPPALHPAIESPLHAPDGFFSVPVAVAGYVIAGAVIVYALRKTDQQLNERLVPLMGVMAAFIFAAQMLNFPVAGGTSGHLIGGALAAALLGPWPAVLVMSTVVAVQALVFQDGGLVVLGVNLLNMAVLNALLAHYVIRAIAGTSPGRGRLLVAGGIAGWGAVMISAAAAAVQLAVSGTSPLEFALPAMLGVHALIGLGEALITVGALSFIIAARRDLLQVQRAG